MVNLKPDVTVFRKHILKQSKMSEKEIHTKETFQVLGMSCAVCVLNVETTLGAQEGVYEAKVNFAASTVFREQRSNLSISLPERTPQKSAANASDSGVRLIAKTPLFLIRSYEKRLFLTEI